MSTVAVMGVTWMVVSTGGSGSLTVTEAWPLMRPSVAVTVKPLPAIAPAV